MDRFLKNTHEILSPLNEITSRLPLTQHQFLTADRKVQRSVFGEGDKAVEVVINLGSQQFAHRSRLGGPVRLPPYGFVVEGPSFAAFHALDWNGLHYEQAPLFTLRSLDGNTLSTSQRVRIFHAFGDARLKMGQKEQPVSKEAVLNR